MELRDKQPWSGKHISFCKGAVLRWLSICLGFLENLRTGEGAEGER